MKEGPRHQSHRRVIGLDNRIEKHSLTRGFLTRYGAAQHSSGLVMACSQSRRPDPGAAIEDAAVTAVASIAAVALDFICIHEALEVAGPLGISRLS